MPVTDCGIIILAAGNSSRLGRPKQLLMYESKTLLQRAIDAATTSGVGEVVVVTGSNHNTITTSLQKNEARFIYNESWQQGMASSMQTGLSALLSSQPALASVIIMLCDQPFVSSLLLQEMIAKKEATHKGIVVCVYRETVGVPALFSHNYFDDLFLLKGAEGAKKIIATNADDVSAISFPQGFIDIDTKEDYEQLIN